jgi:fatty acid desaturase
MNQETFTEAKEALLREIQGRRRNAFFIFTRFWILTIAPFLAGLWLLHLFPLWWVWALVAIAAGFTQNALGILMHEGSHYFLHRAKRLSDIYCNLFVCLPLFNTVQGYRLHHFEHHRCSGEPQDPYFDLYAAYPTRRHLIVGLLLDAIGISAFQRFVHRYVTQGEGRSSKELTYILPCLLVIQGIIAWTCFLAVGRWYAYFILWIAPLITIPVLVNRFRTVVEHYPGFQGVKANRTSITGLIEYLLIAPYGYGNHLEHHLLPQVPYYHLNYAHSFLVSRKVGFTENEVNSRGYMKTFMRLFREMGDRGNKP